MENSSWMCSYSPTLKNRYFEYENKLEDYFDLDTRVKFDIPVIQGWFNIVPYAGFGLTRYTMYADNSWGGQGVTENYAWNDQNNQTNQTAVLKRIQTAVIAEPNLQAGRLLCLPATALISARPIHRVYVSQKNPAKKRKKLQKSATARLT